MAVSNLKVSEDHNPYSLPGKPLTFIKVRLILTLLIVKSRMIQGEKKLMFCMSILPHL